MAGRYVAAIVPAAEAAAAQSTIERNSRRFWERPRSTGGILALWSAILLLLAGLLADRVVFGVPRGNS